jgi:hypothetical protein
VQHDHGSMGYYLSRILLHKPYISDQGSPGYRPFGYHSPYAERLGYRAHVLTAGLTEDRPVG